MSTKEKNMKTMDKMYDSLYSFSNRQFRSDTFLYLSERYAEIEEDVFDYDENIDCEEPDVKIKYILKNAEVAIAPFVFAILKNKSLTIEEKKIFIILVFVAVETLSLAINFSICDEIEDIEEICEILFSGIYNQNTDLIFKEFGNSDALSFQERFSNHILNFSKTYEKELRDLDLNLNLAGLDGEFLGWGNPNFINSVYGLIVTDLDNIYFLLSSSDYTLIEVKR